MMAFVKGSFNNSLIMIQTINYIPYHMHRQHAVFLAFLSHNCYNYCRHVNQITQPQRTHLTMVKTRSPFGHSLWCANSLRGSNGDCVFRRVALFTRYFSISRCFIKPNRRFLRLNSIMKMMDKLSVEINHLINKYISFSHLYDLE